MKRPKINQDYAWFRMKAVRSPIHRYGVVAGENIPARRYVIEYTGTLYNRIQSKKLHAETPPEKLIYIWTVPGYPLFTQTYWIIDGMENGSGAEFINHSCDPNLRMVFHGKRGYYVSRRPIKKGEELTIDYSFEASKDPLACLCGAKKCRGTINVLPANTVRYSVKETK